MIGNQTKSTERKESHGTIAKQDRRNYRRAPREPAVLREQESTIPGVPILTCSNGPINPDTEWNFITFKERMQQYVESVFGDISEIFRSGEYPTYPLPNFDPDELTQWNDPAGIKKEEMKETVRVRIKRLAALEENKPKLYAVIKGQLSRESLNRVSAHPDYSTADANRDPKKLWSIVVNTHLLNCREMDIDVAKTKAQVAFNQCKMMFYESLADFKVRFELRLQVYELAWSMGPPDEDGETEVIDFYVPPAVAAQYFIEKLDPERYGTVQTNYRTKVYPKPNTLEEAFEFINTIAVPKRGHRPVFYQNQKGGRGRNSSNKGGRGQKESKTVSQTKQKNKKGPSAENPCAICGSHTHWAKECPTKNEEGTKREEDVSVNGEQATQVRKNYLAIPHDTMDRDDEHYRRPDLDSMHAQPPTKLEISRSVLAALNQLRDDDIVLDTGGSESIFANADLAVGDQYFTDDGVSIGGAVSGTESIVSFTKMPTTFGDVYYSARCAANILSYSQIKDRAYACFQNPEDDFFRVQMTQGGPTYLFKRKQGIYVMSKLEKLRFESANIVTVQGKKEKYTSDEIARADRARDFIARMGYPSTASAISMINNGRVINCDVTSADILRAQDIYGPPLACLKGKTTNHTTPAERPPEPAVGLIEQQEQSMNVDIMHINGIAFVVNVLTPIRMTLAAKLKSRGLENIYGVLCKQIAEVRSRGFNIPRLKCDPESGLVALRDMLGQDHGIVLETVGNNEHVSIVERKIRVIKERVRGIVNTLPHRLPSKLLPLLVLFCVNRINMTPSVATVSDASPWERFYRKKIDYKKNLRAGFGEYCQAHTNMADNTLSPRTTGGLTMYDTGNGQGTWHIYNLGTDRLIRRNKFTILPIPDIVINHLNNMRDTEGTDDDVNFQIGLENMRHLEENRDTEDEEQRDEVREYNSYMDAIAKQFITINQAPATYDPVAISHREDIEEIEHARDYTDETQGQNGTAEQQTSDHTRRGTNQLTREKRNPKIKGRLLTKVVVKRMRVQQQRPTYPSGVV